MVLSQQPETRLVLLAVLVQVLVNHLPPLMLTGDMLDLFLESLCEVFTPESVLLLGRGQAVNRAGDEAVPVERGGGAAFPRDGDDLWLTLSASLLFVVEGEVPMAVSRLLVHDRTTSGLHTVLIGGVQKVIRHDA